jgi:hypothetical protein
MTAHPAKSKRQLLLHVRPMHQPTLPAPNPNTPTSRSTKPLRYLHRSLSPPVEQSPSPPLVPGKTNTLRVSHINPSAHTIRMTCTCREHHQRPRPNTYHRQSLDEPALDALTQSLALLLHSQTHMVRIPPTSHTSDATSNSSVPLPPHLKHHTAIPERTTELLASGHLQ